MSGQLAYASDDAVMSSSPTTSGMFSAGGGGSAANTSTGTPSKRAGFSVSSLRDATSSSAQSFIADLIASSVPSQSVEGAKAALSLRTTTLQFTRFVHKTGPVFAVQDAIESVFRWQDPILTLVVATAWAFICMYPQLVLLIPSAAFSAILLVNHSRRFPPAPLSLDTPYQEAQTAKPPPTGQPPTEGSVDYLQNLQNIQELMGRVADLTDAGRQLVPLFNWSDQKTSLVLLQLSSATFLLTSIALFFFHRAVDMRYVFLASGELSLLASHPLAIAMINELSSRPSTKLRMIKLKSLGNQILQDDALSDDILLPNEKGESKLVKEIVVFENERRSLDGSWSTDVLKLEDWKPWQVLLDDTEHISRTSTSAAKAKSDYNNSSRSSTPSPSGEEPVKLETIVPPRGYIWMPNEDWQIDRLGTWTAHAFADPQTGNAPAGYVDSEGWASTDADRHLLAPPARVGGSNSSAAMRKRRWFRRIVTSPLYA